MAIPDDPAVSDTLRTALTEPPADAPLMTIMLIAGAFGRGPRPDTTAALLTYVLDYVDAHPDTQHTSNVQHLASMYADTPDLPAELATRLLLTAAAT